MKRLSTIIVIIAGLAANHGIANAQNVKGSNMVVSGQGWYGYDIEKLRPTQTSFGYMTYDLALGFQTEPESGNIYAQQFGFQVRITIC